MALYYPGIRLFLGRKIAKAFRETTLVTWARQIPNGGYKLNKSTNQITVYTGQQNSVIQCGGITDHAELNSWLSAEYGGIYFDQAEELSPDNFATVLSRLRFILPNGKNPKFRAAFVANPANCAFKKLFISDPGVNYSFHQALPSDNPSLPPDYIPRLRELYKYRPELCQALIEGNWNILESGNVLIKSMWVEKAQSSVLPGAFQNKRIISIDPSRFGEDETVIYGWVGTKKVEQDIFSGMDGYGIAARALMIQKKMGANAIVVDGVGVGASTVDALNHLTKDDNNITIIEFQESEKASDSQRFYNKRAEAYWEAGEMFAEGQVCLDKSDDVLARQLPEATYSFSGGRILVEAKEDIKKRLGQSPDRSDAFVIGLWYLRRAPEISLLRTEQNRETSTEKWIAERERDMYSPNTGSYQNNLSR
jgi:hypothetical protein